MVDNYQKISYEFIEFKTNLSKEISNINKFKSNINNECYIIKEKWFNDFEERISKVNSQKNINKEKRKNIFKSFFSKNNPEFINDISSAIKNLEEKSNLKIISKNFVNLLYKKEFILKYNSVKYYAGNYKLILEFINSNISNVLLIINPLSPLLKQTIYHFSINNKIEIKMKVFQALIENEISNKLWQGLKIEAKKLNINFNISKELIQKKSIEIKNPQSFDLIIKLLISLYYYESSLINKDKEKIINYNEKSYLINPEWIEKIKSFYKYSEIINVFINIQKEIDFSDFNKEIEKIFEKYRTNPDINVINIPSSTELFKVKDISPKENKENNCSFYEKFYVFPKKIMEIIVPLFSNNKPSIHSASHFWKKNLLCILKNNNIYIGDFNSNKYFIPEYILCYKDIKNLSSSEFKYLLNASELMKYFEKRKCNDNSAYIQKILGENEVSIGRLIIPNNNNYRNVDSYFNKIEVKENKKHNRSPSVENRGFNNSSLENKFNKIKEENLFDNNDNKKMKNKNLNRSSIENNEIKKNNYLINYNDEDIIEKQNKKNQKELKENEILIKQNEKLKLQINLNENKINEIKNLNETLQKELKNEKEKNKLLEEIKKNLELKLKEKEESDNLNSINDKKKVEKIEKLLSLNKNLEEEKKSLEENLKEYKYKYKEIKQKLKILEKDNNMKEKDIDIENIKEREEIIKENQNQINEKIKFLENRELQLYEEENQIEKIKDQIKNEIKEKEKIMEQNKELIEKNKLLKIEKEKMNIEIIELKNQLNQRKKNINNINRSINISPYENNSINNFGINNSINISINNNNEINNNQRIRRSNSLPNQKKKPLELYIQPTLIGLNNIGATCFMNSTLQCLSQTAELTNYFLSERSENYINNISTELTNKKELCLSKEYLKLIKKLWNKKNQNSPYSPKKFMNIVAEMNPLFKKGDPGDAKDFIIFILEQIHRELKKPIIEQNNIKNVNPLNHNQYDKTIAFNNFFEEFKKECSIISDVFFGINETTNICLNCKNNFNSKGMMNPICYNYGIFNCIIIPLEEVKNMKNNYYNTYNNNIVNINECFIYNQKSELFTGENQNYCNICRQLFNSVYTSQIYISPNNLIIILNRGKGNIYNVKLDFTLQIDITEFVSLKTERTIYDLYGVITHIGKSGPNAHFIASCKSPIDNNWYRYNDDLVSLITNIQSDVIDFGVPYILFYQKHKS